MDGNILFLIILAVVYLFQYLAGRKKDPEGQPPSSPAPPVPPNHRPAPPEAFETESNPEIRDAISEIGRILRGEPLEEKRQPERVPVPTDPDWESAGPDAFQKSGSTDPFEAVRRKQAAEQDVANRREKAAQRQEYASSGPIDHTDHPHTVRRKMRGIPKSEETPVTVKHRNSGRLIPDRQTARDAVVLAEVMGPPLSKRGPRR